MKLTHYPIVGPVRKDARSRRRTSIRMAPSDDLETRLLRSSVDRLGEDLHRCEDCGRTPLIGERIYAYVSDEVVCELCRALRGEEPIASRLVRHDSGENVRVRARVA